jgi:arginase
MASFEGKNFKFLGAATSIGQPKSGVEKTSEVLKAEHIETLFEAGRASWLETLTDEPFEREADRTRPIRNVEGMGRYLKALYEVITTRLTPSDFLVTFGGDHSVASGTISGLLRVHGPELSVIWVDAHADCNTPETSPSGNFHGMPVAHLLGLFSDPNLDWGQEKLDLSRFALIGIRDLDPLEEVLVNKIGLFYFTMKQVNELGIEHCIQEAFKHVDPLDQRLIHLSVDVDGLDPSLFPGTGTSVNNGLSFEHYQAIVKRVKECGQRFVSMDVVEVNFEIEKEKTLESVKELLRITFS